MVVTLQNSARFLNKFKLSDLITEKIRFPGNQVFICYWMEVIMPDAWEPCFREMRLDREMSQEYISCIESWAVKTRLLLQAAPNDDWPLLTDNSRVTS